MKNEDMLRKNLLLSTCFKGLTTKRATATMLAMYGRPNEVLQLSQNMCKKSRAFCKQENGFKKNSGYPGYFKNLSLEAIAWEDDLISLRLQGKLHICKFKLYFFIDLYI